MKNKLIKFYLSITTILTFGFAFPSLAHAESSFLPDVISDLLDQFGLLEYITSRVQFLIFAFLVIIMLAAIVYSLIAGFKYIQSQGDPGKIEEAQKGIKAVLMGIASVFVSIIGIALVVLFLGGEKLPTELYESCLYEPASAACTVCKEDGVVDGNQCDFCEKEYKKRAIDDKHVIPNRCVN